MSENDQESLEETDGTGNIQDFFDDLDQEVYNRQPTKLLNKVLEITKLDKKQDPQKDLKLEYRVTDKGVEEDSSSDDGENIDNEIIKKLKEAEEARCNACKKQIADKMGIELKKKLQVCQALMAVGKVD